MKLMLDVAPLSGAEIALYMLQSYWWAALIIAAVIALAIIFTVRAVRKNKAAKTETANK